MSVTLSLEISRSKVVVLERAANLIIFTVVIIRGIILLRGSLVFLVHPLTLAGALILYAILTSGIVGYITFSWAIYILVLIFLGGVIVLVVYITTLAANEKFILLENYGGLLFIVTIVVLGGQAIMPAIKISGGVSPGRNMVTPIYDAANTTLYVFSVLYLLLALVCVVKVIKLEKGPLVIRI